MEAFSKLTARIPTTRDLFIVLAIGFGVTAGSHFVADIIAPWVETNAPALNKFSLNSSFFWLIVLATTGGVMLSFTKARELEGVGASKIGTLFIFILVATIGLRMDIRAVVQHPGLFLVGGIWMLFHVVLLLIVARSFERLTFSWPSVAKRTSAGRPVLPSSPPPFIHHLPRWVCYWPCSGTHWEPTEPTSAR